MNTINPLFIPDASPIEHMTLNEAEALLKSGRVSSEWFFKFFSYWVEGKNEFRVRNGTMEKCISWGRGLEDCWVPYFPYGFTPTYVDMIKEIYS